jgi:hypothetical protein
MIESKSERKSKKSSNKAINVKNAYENTKLCLKKSRAEFSLELVALIDP